ncbi:MAG: M14 family metallocarboxypeptidase [Verrucomicrobiales bacterium]|nr:M14 family metallocarboxypeptidase [Verrucomicrobiales bacterium]
MATMQHIPPNPGHWQAIPVRSSKMTPEQEFLSRHSAHDYDAVLDRWREIAEAARLKEVILAHDEVGKPFVVYETQKRVDAETGTYLCAGVHGDEPAGVWGLIEWASANIDFLRENGAVIFPCFNPSGLIGNTRHDSENRDLNRLFQDKSIPVLAAWHWFMKDRKIRLALHLHEDYDAQGIYLYELSREGETFGDAVLERVSTIIPRDPRDEIDGSDFENAVLLGFEDGIRERVETHLNGGYPEAIFLFLKMARYTLTFETPSEFSLWDRVQAHKKFIEEAIQEGICR